MPQVCEALEYAHEEGFVHRDIKPENIFLDKKGQVKIGDFGLAKILNRPPTDFTLTQPQQRMGTPNYMAPEQIEGSSNVDHRADIYSLGVVFYEMLTGELPLGRFDPPSRKVHVDVRLDEVVLHTLEKEPARRYQHASDVKTDVETISAHERQVERSADPVPSPRFSRKAVAGIACVPFLIFFLGMLSTPERYKRFEGLLTPTGEDWGSWFFTLVVTVLGIASPFAMIILGAMALHDIRHSGGKVAGLPLALADVILLPLLVLDFAIFVLFVGNQSPFAESQRSWIPAAALSCLVLDFLFARWCWRRVDARVKAKASQIPVSEKDVEQARRALRIPSIGIRITGLLDCLILIGLPLMIVLTTFSGKGRGVSILGGVFESTLMIAMLIPSIVIFMGGMAMPKCKSHGLAVAASILAVAPIHPAFWLGLPFGIWALVVLNRSETRRAFAGASERSANATKKQASSTTKPDKPRNSKKSLGVFSMCSAILGIIAGILLWLLFVILERFDIQAPYTICAIVFVGAEVIALITGIVGWRSPYGKAGVGISAVLLLLVVLLMPAKVETRRGNTGTTPVRRAGLHTPDNAAYENADGTRGLQIEVGPTQFSIEAVARWGRTGPPIVENGKGWTLGEPDFKTPDYSALSQWMDIANIYLSPEASEYDVLELRVFDHETRELLQLEDRLGIGFDVNDGVVQLRSVGGLLPDSVDVWMRVLHNPPTSPMWRLNAEQGASAGLDEGSLLFREVRDGSWSYATRSGSLEPLADGRKLSVAEVEWNKWSERGAAVCTAVFDFVNAKGRMPGERDRYQIAAIAKDGSRHVPDFPHFLSAGAGKTQVIKFDLPAEQLSHLEIRPFHGRDRFYFDGIELPHVDGPPADPPPTLPIKLKGSGGGMVTADLLDPLRFTITILKGERATGVESRREQAWVEMAAEPYENADSIVTIVYEIQGLRVRAPLFRCIDSEGNEIDARTTTKANTSLPQGLTVGFETKKISIERIDEVLFSIRR